MSCFAEAMRLDLRRNALWMALAALLIFLLAPLAGMSAQMTARQTARAVEAASALAGVAALCGLFFPERERGVREAIAARGVPLWMVWSARAVWLLVALWVSSCAAALLLEVQGSEISRRMALAGFANAAFTGGLAALCAAFSGSLALAAALPSLWFAVDLCGLIPPRLTLFTDAFGLPGNKLTLFLAGLLLLALAVLVRTRRPWRA